MRFLLSISFLFCLPILANEYRSDCLNPSYTVQPWLNPNIRPSPPPPLMGKQMGVVETIGVPPLGFEMDGDVKVFTLIVQPVEHLITDGIARYWDIVPEKYRYNYTLQEPIVQWVRGWGINGSIAGPTIEAVEGDRVRFIVKNELPEPTSIHWHGILLPNDLDGAGGVTQYPILPGETYEYEFTLYQVGTFMYHSGFTPTKQDGLGISGMMVIHAKDGSDRVDRDFAILLQQWDILAGNSNLIVLGMDDNWFTMNGRSAPNIPVLNAQQGETVRIRWGNLSMAAHPIHLHGYTWWVTGTEGGRIPKSAWWPGATINVAPGQTRDTEFTAWNPGVWRLHCHKLHHIVNGYRNIVPATWPPGGMYTYLHVTPTDPDAPWTPPTEAER